jgi:hypothetical protein
MGRIICRTIETVQELLPGEHRKPGLGKRLAGNVFFEKKACHDL